MTILLRMDDKMNRQLTCSITDADTALSLSQELVHFGFINEVWLLASTCVCIELYNNDMITFLTLGRQRQNTCDYRRDVVRRSTR